MAHQGHSRSIILESLESRQGRPTSWRRNSKGSEDYGDRNY